MEPELSPGNLCKDPCWCSFPYSCHMGFKSRLGCRVGLLLTSMLGGSRRGPELPAGETRMVFLAPSVGLAQPTLSRAPGERTRRQEGEMRTRTGTASGYSLQKQEVPFCQHMLPRLVCRTDGGPGEAAG